MTSPSVAARPRVSPELRAGIFHFTVYMSGAATSAYFGIWLAGKGIMADQVGIISAAPIVLTLILNLVVGRLADRARDWRDAIVVLALVSGLAHIGLFFAEGFWGILLVWTVLSVPTGGIPPLVDAATLRMTRRNGTDFSVIRAWGTVGFTIAGFLGGAVVALFGPPAFVPTVVLLALLRTAAALQLPQFRAPVHLRDTRPSPGAARLALVLRPWFILPLLAFGLLQVTHGIIYSFGALIWQEQGISATGIGLLIATGGAAEALMMFVWRRVGGRFSARHMMLVASIAAVVRWGGMALGPPLPVMIALQALHALTFAGGYFGMVHFIANWTSEDIAAEAQGFAAMVQQGMVAIGLVVFGSVVAAYGAASFVAAAACGVGAVLCVIVSLALRPARTEVSR